MGCGVATWFLFVWEKRLKSGFLIFGACVSAVAGAQTKAFDDLTGINPATLSALSTTPRGLLGTAVQLGNLTGADQLVSFDVDVASFAAVNYTDVQLQVTFFGTFNASATGSAPVFSNVLDTESFDFGANALSASTLYSATSNVLAHPFAVGSQAIGVQFLWLAKTSANGALAFTDNLSTGLQITAPPSVGTNVPGGIFINYSNPSPTTSATSLVGSDLSVIPGAPSTNLAFTLYTQAVPEPGIPLVLVLGGLALARKRL
jgi:hypothetical protein